MNQNKAQAFTGLRFFDDLVQPLFFKSRALSFNRWLKLLKIRSAFRII